MAKSKIIKELANNEISLEVAINRLLIIASDINNKELSQWAEQELNGYTSEDTIPAYRIVKNTMFRYSGINGRMKATNVPLPLKELLKGHDEDIFDMNIYDGIKTIEGFINSDTDVQYGRDLTWAASMVYRMTGIQCYSITQTVPENALENTVNTVKTLLLKVLIQLDKSYGCMDDLDIDITNKTPEEVTKLNTIINNYIFNDNSIKIGDKNKIKDTDILTGGTHK
nr:hypothetical protein [uncultured Anaerocolumna sp.]